MRQRRKALLGGAIALVALLVLVLARPGEHPDAAVDETAVGKPPAPGPGTRPDPLASIAARPQSAPPGAVAPPVFDSVRLEKDEVCEGEENLVTVRAHTVDGNDAFLHYTIAGEAGSQVPVRAYLGRDGKASPQHAVAFSRNNVATRIELPSYRVKSCRPERILVVSMRMLPNSPSERELSASVQTLQGAPFVPAWYDWSFGDGEAAVTAGPVTVHDYSALPQQSAFTDLLVKVKASDGGGQTVEGRLPLQIRNVAFATRARGLATIFATPIPRFPEIGADGVVRQKFRLWHAEDVAVQITGATMAKFLLPTNEGSPPPPVAVAVDHTRLLQHGEINPGAFVDEPLEYDFGADPAVYAVTFTIQGVTTSGMQARGELTLLRPPPKPTRDNSIPIQDPAMEQKIRRAMMILNQQTVSQEELWRLEREGKLR
jgi:hypothetical protein